MISTILLVCALTFLFTLWWKRGKDKPVVMLATHYKDNVLREVVVMGEVLTDEQMQEVSDYFNERHGGGITLWQSKGGE